MQGEIVQVSVSPGGLPKRAIPFGMLTPHGVEGDGWAHAQIHGGPLQAVLLITSEGIEEVAALGYPLVAGSLGENLTTRGLDRRRLRPGQIVRAGAALLELTRIRVPCTTLDIYGGGIQAALYDLAVKDGDVQSPRWALSGFYARVLEAGIVRPGDIIAVEATPA